MIQKYAISTFALILLMHNLVVTVKADDGDMRAKQFIGSVAQECKTEQITEADVESILINGPTSQEGKCFIACTMKKLGLLAENGEFIPGGVEALGAKIYNGNVPEREQQIGKSVVEKCGALKGADECETAFILYECGKAEHAASPK